MLEQKQSKLDSIQALRGIAALLVLVFHIAGHQIQILGEHPTSDLWVKKGPWYQGYAGVDLFFLISGFVMVYVTRNTGQTLSDVLGFVKKRATRIYPLWWILASFMGAYFFITYRMLGAPDLSGVSPPATGYFIKSLLLIPQDHDPVLRLGWTLIHEMQFYLIFAVLLFAPRRWLPALLTLWAGVNISGYFLGWTDTGAVQAIVFSLLSLEFIAGAAVALLMIRGVNVAPKPILIIGIALTLIALIFYTDNSTSLTKWGRVVVYTLPFAMIIYGASVMEQAGRIKVPRWLTTLGDWSYSLYLSHYLVLLVIRRIGGLLAPYLPESLVARFTVGAPGLLDNIAFITVGFVLSIITAGLCYYILERPLLRLARPTLASDRK